MTPLLVFHWHFVEHSWLLVRFIMCFTFTGVLLARVLPRIWVRLIVCTLNLEVFLWLCRRQQGSAETKTIRGQVHVQTYRGLKAREVDSLRAGRGSRAGTEGAERGGDLVDEGRHDHLLCDAVQHHPYHEVQQKPHLVAPAKASHLRLCT